MLVNKKGSGHLEMVISFVFFLGFVLFLFIFLTPEDTTTLSGAVILGLHDSFEEKVHTNFSSFFLKSNYVDDGSGCFFIDLPDRIFEYAVDDGDSYVTILAGGKADSDLEGGDLNINDDGEFFRVAISPEFDDEALVDCDFLDDYEMGSIIERRVISYSSFESMKDEYYSDYSKLRNELGVPPIYDFAIIPEDISDFKMEPKNGIPDSVDVMARDYVFEVLRSDGTFNNERISFRIW